MSKLLRSLLDRLSTDNIIGLLNNDNKQIIFTQVGAKLIDLGPEKLAELTLGNMGRPFDQKVLRDILIDTLIENDIEINASLKKNVKLKVEPVKTASDDACGRVSVPIKHTC